MEYVEVTAAARVFDTVPPLDGDPGLLWLASRACGGATLTRGEGRWIDDDGREVIEPVAIVRVFGESRRSLMLWVESVDEVAKNVYGQSSVLVFESWTGEGRLT